MTETTDRLSKRSQRVNESTTLAIASESKRMIAEGIRVVSLATGEPDFPSPDCVKAAAIDAINRNFTHYTQSNGIPELRAAIAEKFTRENDMPTDPADVLVSCGGKHSLFNTLAAICDDGDEVIIPAPYWVSYPEIVELVGGIPVVVSTTADEHYKLTPDTIRAHATSRTRAIIINSPSNPTGVVYTPEELHDIVNAVADLGIYLISDELYEKILYNGVRHFSPGSLERLSDLAITINGVSKAYSMTGWRIGYMRGPRDIVAAAARIQSQVTSNPSSISQMAALAAITQADDDVARMVATFSKRRDAIIAELRAIPDVSFPEPDGAFYLLVDVSRYFGESAPDSVALASRLLREHHVATVPGSAFGDERTIRLSYACSDDDIREGTAKLREGLEALRRDA